MIDTGTWGTSLYANDSTCDVRSIYLNFLEDQLSNQEAYEKTLEKCKEYIGDDDEPLFWFALAETQWKVGRLMPEVKAKALEWIEKDGGMDIWEDSKNEGGWKKALEKLKTKLETEQQKEKLFRKIVFKNQNPWKLNDIYAYRVHKENISKEARAIYGKYILMQKIGEGKNAFSSDIVMRIQIFDRLFDEIPSVDDVLETVSNYRLLPFSDPISQQKRYKWRLQGKPDPSFGNRPLCIYNPVCMSAKMEQCKDYKDANYPKDELTFICSVESPINKQHERTDGEVDNSYMWYDIHYKIGKQFALWQGVNYDVIGDGTFEYPTREQQKQIKAEIWKKPY